MVHAAIFFPVLLSPTPAFDRSLYSRSTAKVVAEEKLMVKKVFGEQRQLGVSCRNC